MSTPQRLDEGKHGALVAHPMPKKGDKKKKGEDDGKATQFMACSLEA